MNITERDIYVGALAHAIRLGKRPAAGLVMSGNLSLDELDTATGAVKPGKKTPIEFLVTQELLDAAAAAINAQDVTYREPKTSVLHKGKPVPPAVWDYARKVQK